MKNTIAFFVLLFCISLHNAAAQAPKKFKYQAVARDNGGLIKSQDIDIRINLCQNFNCSSPFFTENHDNVGTNEFGLFTIGIGSVNQGAFSQIDWSMGEFWLKVEMKLNNSNQYYAMDPVQLLSVPFSLYAADGPDADPANEIQTLSKSGNVITLFPGGGSVSVDDADANPTNEIQQLSVSGNTLSISGSGGNSISLPGNSRIAFLGDIKSSGLEGGDFNVNVWQPRLLNTLTGDNSFVNLAGGSIGVNGTANQFVLQPGTYLIDAICPVMYVGWHQAKLFNVSANSDVILGTSGWSGDSGQATNFNQDHSVIRGIFTITQPNTFSILHRGTRGQVINGMGGGHNFGENIYTHVQITKIN